MTDHYFVTGAQKIDEICSQSLSSLVGKPRAAIEESYDYEVIANHYIEFFLKYIA